jgi:hypothetical protein
MATFGFEFRAGRQLQRVHDDTLKATMRIEDRVRRRDLEAEARYAGTILAAVQAAERALREAPDSSAASAAAAAYVEKLERAEQAVATAHARVLEAVPNASASSATAEG